ncbi:MAG: hypothetical protein COA42_20065 [Alteromonadaceae bacterium]|nr:MAG: hypothetical protein COA42_20065 [Alteromonadaceae bacterium]
MRRKNCVNGCGALDELQYEGVAIDQCQQCKGIWLDTSELTEIIQTKKQSWPEATIEKVLATCGGSGVPEKERRRSLPCPLCGDNLPAVNYQGNSGVIVNTCANNHGVWLDAGELSKIQIYMENRHRVGKTFTDKHQQLLNDAEIGDKLRHTESRLERVKEWRQASRKVSGYRDTRRDGFGSIFDFFDF